MGMITDPPASAVIREANMYKEASLENPEGVQYMDHLAELIANENSLNVVMRSEGEVFEDVPIRAWWSYGRYDFDSPDRPVRSSLTFEIPDEITRRIQSRHASAVMGRFFGMSSGVELVEPILGSTTDETRVVQERWSGRGELAEIVNDWDLLKSAINATSKDYGAQLGGQSIRLASTANYSSYGLARVDGEQLQIYMSRSAIEPVISLWNTAFKQAVNIIH